MLISEKLPHRRGPSLDSSLLGTEDVESDSDTRNARPKASLTPAAVLEGKLAAVAADALLGTSQHSSLLRMSAARISSIEFRHILKEFDCGVTKSEEKMLERKYKHVPTGTISLAIFLEDIQKLGRRRQQYLDSMEGKSEEDVSSMLSKITATEGTSSLQGGSDRIEFQHAVRVSHNGPTLVDSPTTMSPCPTVDSEEEEEGQAYSVDPLAQERIIAEELQEQQLQEEEEEDEEGGGRSNQCGKSGEGLVS